MFVEYLSQLSQTDSLNGVRHSVNINCSDPLVKSCILPQYPQADSSKQLWNPPQVQGSLGKIMPVKQSYYLQAQDPLKLFEQSLQPPVMQQQPLEKKMKPFPVEPYNQNPSEVKMPEYYWDSSYGMADNRVMAQQSNMDRRGKRQGVFRPEQDAVSRMTFEVKIHAICGENQWGSNTPDNSRSFPVSGMPCSPSASLFSRELGISKWDSSKQWWILHFSWLVCGIRLLKNWFQVGLSLDQCRCDIDLCTVSVRLRNMAADSFGEILVWQLMKTIKAIQIIAVELLPFRWTLNTHIVSWVCWMAEAAIVRLRLEIKDGRSSLVLDFFF